MNNKAKVAKQSWLSPVWLIPIIAAVVGFWMVYQSEAGKGPEVQLEITSAEGIEAGKTLVKARDVEIGRVDSLRLSDDFSSAIVTLQMNAAAEPLLRSDTQFWVVKPRIARDGISGLGTLLSGAYIQVEPGTAEQRQTSFVALEQPPLTSADTKGLRITLISDVAGSLGVGEMVTFRGFPVGQVEEAEFDPEQRLASYQLFIEAPYDVLVTENTRFWMFSGLSVQVGAEGVKFDLGSLETLLSGGVTFDVPRDQPRGDQVQPQTEFRLFSEREDAIQQGYARAIEYVLLFDDSIRGLAPGAAVEYRGVRVGTVAAAPFKFYPEDDTALPLKLIPIKIRFEPDRLEGLVSDTDLDGWRERLHGLFNEGMRASLKANNLLTNSLYVDLAFYDETMPDSQLEELNGLPVMPSVSSGLAQLEQKVSRLLDSFNSIPMESIGTKLNTALADSSALFEQLQQTNARLDSLLASDDTQALPAALKKTLSSINETLAGFDQNTPAYQQLQDSLQQLNEVLRDLRPLAETLNRQPNALIFDRTPVADPQPQKGN